MNDCVSFGGRKGREPKWLCYHGYFISKSIKLSRLFLLPVNGILLSFILSFDKLNSEAKLKHFRKREFNTHSVNSSAQVKL